MVFYKEVVPVGGSKYPQEAVGLVKVSSGNLQDSGRNEFGEFSSTHTIMRINSFQRIIQNVAHIKSMAIAGTKNEIINRPRRLADRRDHTGIKFV